MYCIYRVSGLVCSDVVSPPSAINFSVVSFYRKRKQSKPASIFSHQNPSLTT